MRSLNASVVIGYLSGYSDTYLTKSRTNKLPVPETNIAAFYEAYEETKYSTKQNSFGTVEDRWLYYSKGWVNYLYGGFQPATQVFTLILPGVVDQNSLQLPSRVRVLGPC